jgi:hypothetical protein
MLSGPGPRSDRKARATSTIPAAALLEAWERGRAASPGERGLILLGVAHPEVPATMLAGWTVGERDAGLLALLEQSFGPGLAAVAECPRCNEPLEADFPVAAITVARPRDKGTRFALECAGHRVMYRLPTAGDLAALGDPTLTWDSRQSAARWLLERCVVGVDRPAHGSRDRKETTDDAARQADAGSPADDPLSVPAVGMPDAVLRALETAMADTVAAADPQAEIELALTCPACGLLWRTPFDVVNFLWQEIDAWAASLLGEVHILASNYGWSERDILALSPLRRAYYLDLIGA